MIKTHADQNMFEKTKKNFSLLKSLVYLNNLNKYNYEEEFVDHVSVSLNPKQIQRQYMEEFLKDSSKFGQTLMFLNRKFENIRKFFDDYASEDELVQNFLKMIDRSRELNPVKKGVIAICRYDYMMDENYQKFMQLEYNQVAVSMGFHEENAINMVKQLQKSLFNQKYNFIDTESYTQDYQKLVQIAFEKYANKDACILIHKEKTEVNIFEMLQIQRLTEKLGIDCIIMNRQDYSKDDFCKKDDKFYYKDREVAVIFHRTMYDNIHMEELSMEFYSVAESSRCYNIPDMYSSLLSLKVLQLLFFMPELMEEYDVKELQEHTLMKNLTPTYNFKYNFQSSKQKMLDFINKQGKENLILKTSQEGGFGHILSGQEMIDFINESSDAEMSYQLLVYKIQHTENPSIAYIKNKLEYFEDTVSEIGIYYNYVFDYNQDGEFVQEYQGQPFTLVKTKRKGTSKGGISVNAAFIDTLCYQD